MSRLQSSRDHFEQANASPDIVAEAFLPFFKDAAQRLYGRDSGACLRWRQKPPRWEAPLGAISKELANPWEGSTGWAGLDKGVFLATCGSWLSQMGIHELSFVAHGWKGCTGATFDAPIADSTIPNVVRIGVSPPGNDFFQKRWCPLVHQPDAQLVGSTGTQEGHRFFLECTPCLEMIDWLKKDDEPYPPSGFAEFLNERILVNTPFEVSQLFDLALTPEGKPMFAGWDPLRIKPGQKEYFAEHQWDSDYQQTIMRTLHENCQAAGWPPELNWVARLPSGNFVENRNYTARLPASPPDNTITSGPQI